MQGRHASRFSLQKGEDIVLKWSYRPKRGGAVGLDFGKFPGKPAEQVKDVHALVEQLATACEMRLRAPFFVVSTATPVTVDASHKVKSANGALLEEVMGFLNRRMVAVVVSGFKTKSFSIGSFDREQDFGRSPTEWFFA